MTTPAPTDQPAVSSVEVVWRFLAYQVTEGRPGPTSVMFLDRRDQPHGRASIHLTFTNRADAEQWLAVLDDAEIRPNIQHASAYAYGWSWMFGWSA